MLFVTSLDHTQGPEGGAQTPKRKKNTTLPIFRVSTIKKFHFLKYLCSFLCRVVVFIPLYNRGTYLKERLRKILTFRTFSDAFFIEKHQLPPHSSSEIHFMHAFFIKNTNHHYTVPGTPLYVWSPAYYA